MNQIQNPFDHEENLSTWFNEDKFYSNSKLQQLEKFKIHLKQSPNHQNNSIMSFQDSYKNFVNTITKHSITATLIMLLALSTVSVAAAQLFAPEEFKPSNLTGLTKKPEPKPQPTKEEEKPLNMDKEGEVKTVAEEKNSEITFLGDSQNDVVLVDSCDLQVNIKKNITYGGQLTNGYTFDKKIGLLLSYKTAPFGPGFGIQIDCSNKAMTFEEFNKTVKRTTAPESNTKYFEDDENLGKVEIENISKEDICKNVGLTIFLCEQVRNQNKITVPLADGSITAYFFSTATRSYIVNYIGSTQTESPVKIGYYTGVIKSEQPATPTKKLLSYTNPYFPDFKLVYPEDWKFETKTENVGTFYENYKNLLIRTVTISKNNKTIQITLQPKSLGDSNCGGGGAEPKLLQTFSNKLNKLNTFIGGDTVEYNFEVQSNGICPTKSYFNTIIDSNFDKDYVKSFPNDKIVQYSILIRVFNTKDGSYILTNDSTIGEIDNILSQSTLPKIIN